MTVALTHWDSTVRTVAFTKPRLRKRRLSKTKSVEVAEAAAAAASDDVEPKEKLEEAFKLLDEVEEAWLPKETVCYLSVFFAR